MNSVNLFMLDAMVRSSVAFCATALLTSANPGAAASWMLCAVAVEKMVTALFSSFFMKAGVGGFFAVVEKGRGDGRLGLAMFTAAAPFVAVIVGISSWLILSKTANLTKFSAPLSFRIFTYLTAAAIAWKYCPSQKVDK